MPYKYGTRNATVHLFQPYRSCIRLNKFIHFNDGLYAGFCNYELHIFVPFPFCSSCVCVFSAFCHFRFLFKRSFCILPYILISSFFDSPHSSFKDSAWIFNATYKVQSTKFCFNAWEIFLNYINIHNFLLSPEIKQRPTIILFKLWWL